MENKVEDKMKIPTGRWALLFLMLFCSCSLNATCGFSWSLQRATAYPNIDYDGILRFSDWVYDIELSDGTKLPVEADFASSRKTSSKNIGFGWFLNLTDIALVKQDLQAYKIFLPNDLELKANAILGKKDTYQGSGWMLSVKNMRAQLSRSCGTDMLFYDYRITRLKNKAGCILNFTYSGKRLESISDNGKKIVNFSYVDSEDSSIIKLYILKDKKEIIFKCQNIDSVGRILTQIEIPEDKEIISYSYDFSTPHEWKIKRSKTLCDDCEYSWNPADGVVMSGRTGKDSHKYSVIPGRKCAKGVKRVSVKNGLSEFQAEDSNIATEESRLPGGPLVIVSKIAGNNNVGKPRRIETIYDDGSSDVLLYNYDDKGRLIREIKNGKILCSLSYAKDGSISALDKLGNFMWTKKYDSDGRLLSYQRADGTLLILEYIDADMAKVELTKNNKKIQAILDINSLNEIEKTKGIK